MTPGLRRLLTALVAALLAVLVAPTVAAAAPRPGPGIIVKLRPGADPGRQTRRGHARVRRRAGG